MSPTSVDIEVGEQFSFTATPHDDEGRKLDGWEIVWSTSDEEVVTVDEDGRISAHEAGRASVIAVIDGHLGMAEVNVAPVPVADIEISHGSAHLEVGEEFQLTATPVDANGEALSGRELVWSSSQESVATVDQDGLVTTHSPGVSSIKAESEGKQVTSQITVHPPPVGSVEVSPPSATIRIGQRIRLTATPYDEEGHELTDREVTWSTTNRFVARVNSQGRVTGQGFGTATITATIEGHEGTARITVSLFGSGS